MKFSAFLAAAALAAGLAGGAHAGVVQFTGYPSTSWADGTMSTNLSGYYPDGFFSTDSTTAYNGFGWNNESISWNDPTTLNSLEVENLPGYGPDTLTASLYDSSNDLLASQTIAPTDSFSTLTFNTKDVSKLTLSFTGGADYYGIGHNSAWYYVSNVTYGMTGGVPEPATWGMLLLGLFGLGALLRARRDAPAGAAAAA